MEYDGIYINPEGRRYGCDATEVGQLGDGEYRTRRGTKLWFKDEVLHREDGPALITKDGIENWYLNGKRLTKSEWDNKMAPNKLRDEGWDESDIDLMSDLGMFETSILDFKNFRKLNRL